MSGPLSKGDLLGALTHKFGFEPVRLGRKTRRGHEAYTLKIGGKKIATTRFSRQSKSYSIGLPLLRRMAAQLRVTSADYLHEMVDCTKSRAEYLADLRDAGYLD